MPPGKVQLDEGIGIQKVVIDFDWQVETNPSVNTTYDVLLQDFESATKGHDLKLAKMPEDFQVKTDVMLFNRKFSSVHNEYKEKNKEALINSGFITDMSLLNTKENRAELGAVALQERNKEISVSRVLG